MGLNSPLISEAQHVKYLIEMEGEQQSLGLNLGLLLWYQFEKTNNEGGEEERIKEWYSYSLMIFIRFI